MTTDRAALLTAVNKLVQDSSANHLYLKMLELIPVARRIGARFVGDDAELNPLIDLAVADADKYASVMQLVETKRAQQGMPALDAARTEDGHFDKVDYMRDFMQEKRLRERRAADIENMIRAPKDRLVGRARLDFMQMQSKKWKQQRDVALDAARAECSGKLSRAQMSALLDKFWAKIDSDLDDLEELARAEMLKPSHQRKAG